MKDKKLKRPELLDDTEHTPTNQPVSTQNDNEVETKTAQFEREFGAHNRDRKSGWNADDEQTDEEKES